MICHFVFTIWLCSKATIGLTAAQASAMLADGISTRRAVQIGAVETNPITRALMGGYRPTWGRMAPVGLVLIEGSATWGAQMRRSKGWTRRVWWIPQAVSIAGNLAGVELTMSHVPSRAAKR
jgi:hypothetical protein